MILKHIRHLRYIRSLSTYYIPPYFKEETKREQVYSGHSKPYAEGAQVDFVKHIEIDVPSKLFSKPKF